MRQRLESRARTGVRLGAEYSRRGVQRLRRTAQEGARVVRPYLRGAGRIAGTLFEAGVNSADQLANIAAPSIQNKVFESSVRSNIQNNPTPLITQASRFVEITQPAQITALSDQIFLFAGASDEQITQERARQQLRTRLSDPTNTQSLQNILQYIDVIPMRPEHTRIWEEVDNLSRVSNQADILSSSLVAKISSQTCAWEDIYAVSGSVMAYLGRLSDITQNQARAEFVTKFKQPLYNAVQAAYDSVNTRPNNPTQRQWLQQRDALLRRIDGMAI